MQVPEKYKFIVQLGKALHIYGVPSYKSQKYLNKIAAKKSIKGSFMDLPTWINYVFYEEDEHTYNYVECVPVGELNLGALSKITEVTNKVISNDLSFGDAKTEIEKIKTTRLGYGWFVELLAFMCSAGAFSIILNTSWVSAITASFLGALVYGITQLSKKSGYLTSVLESLVAFVATMVTGILSLFIDQLHISLTILASIIVFIPGLSITTALEEITSKSLVSGTAKLFDALISLFKQFFGVVMGLAVLSIFVKLKPSEVHNDIPPWMDYIAVLLLASSLLPVFKVRSKDFILCILTGFASYYTTLLLDFTGILLSIFIGTIVAVVSSKVFSKLTKSPELVYLIPGLIMLVPGSKAFISLSSVFIQDSGVQSNMGFQLVYIFMGIIGGLIFSGSFVEAKHQLRRSTKNY